MKKKFGCVTIMAVLVLCVFLVLAADHGVWCQQEHRLEWSVAGVAPFVNSSLEVQLGDEIVFVCPNDSFSNVIYNADEIQFDMCDTSASSGNHFTVGECLGEFAESLQTIRRVPVPVASTIPYNIGVTVYFTSYSDGASVASATGMVSHGGECLMGLKLAVTVVDNTVPISELPEPTIVPSGTMVPSDTNTPIVPPETGGSKDDSLGTEVTIGIGAGGGVALLIILLVLLIPCICICYSKKRGRKVIHGGRVTPDGAVSNIKSTDIEKGQVSITSIKVELLGNEEVKRVSVKEARKSKDAAVTNGVGKQPLRQEYDTPKPVKGAKVDVPAKKGSDSIAKPNGVSKTPLKPGKVQSETKSAATNATTEDKKRNKPTPVKPAPTTTKPSISQPKPLKSPTTHKPSGTRTPGEGTESLAAPKKPQVSVQIGAGRATFSTTQDQKPPITNKKSPGPARATFSTAQDQRPSGSSKNVPGPARSTGDPTKPPSGPRKPSTSQETAGGPKSPTERSKPARPAPVAKPSKTGEPLPPLRQDSEPCKLSSPPPDYHSVVNPVQSLPLSSAGRRVPPPPPPSGKLPPLNKPIPSQSAGDSLKERSSISQSRRAPPPAPATH